MSIKVALISAFGSSVIVDSALLRKVTNIINASNYDHYVICSFNFDHISRAELRAFSDALNEKQATRQYVEKICKICNASGEHYEKMMTNCIDDMITVRDKDNKVSYTLSLSQLAEDYEYFACLQRGNFSDVRDHTLDLTSTQVTIFYKLYLEYWSRAKEQLTEKTYYDHVVYIANYLQAKNDYWFYCCCQKVKIPLVVENYRDRIEAYRRLGLQHRLIRSRMVIKLSEMNKFDCWSEVNTNHLATFNDPEPFLHELSKENIERSGVSHNLSEIINHDPMWIKNEILNKSVDKFVDMPFWCIIVGICCFNVIYPLTEDILEALIEVIEDKYDVSYKQILERLIKIRKTYKFRDRLCYFAVNFAIE